MIYLSYPSAMDYWFNGTGREYPTNMERCSFQPELASPRGDTLNLKLPTIMIPRRRRNYNNQYVVPSVHLPENSFVIVKDGVAVASPELCFLEAARVYCFEFLVELGNRLCSQYVFDANNKCLQHDRFPITNVAQIASFLSGASAYYGSANASRAVKYVKNMSGSPVEDRMAVSFFIPLSRGGLKIFDGDLNGQANLTPEALDFMNGKPVHSDVLWNDRMVACEYDSDMTHGDDWQRKQDAKRQTALNQSGYKVARFTRADLSNFATYEKAVMLLLDDLGMDNKDPRLKKYAPIRQQLFMNLFKTNHQFFNK